MAHGMLIDARSGRGQYLSHRRCRNKGPMVARGRQALRVSSELFAMVDHPHLVPGLVGKFAELRSPQARGGRSDRARSGIDKVHAELLPEDKVIVIDSPITKYGSVAMFGNGVNDAPVMARASKGIAKGAAGRTLASKRGWSIDDR